jgi:hypothetical protein cdiviTM7_02774
MSLQTGSELARTSREVINPKNLSVAAYELEGRLLDQHPSLLRVDDIREIGPLGMIIDSTDEIVGVDDVISLKEIYDIGFTLKDKLVIDEKKHKIGRVIGYTLAAGSFIIQQLRIRRPLLKSFGDTELLIHRSQIVKITDEKIIVKSATVSHATEKKIPTPRINSYDNPFRKQPNAQPESAKID